MKKIISILLSALLISFSVISANAFEENSVIIIIDEDEPTPEQNIIACFLDYYKHKEHGKQPTETEAFIFDNYETFLANSKNHHYGIIKFTSPDAIQEPYYNRFGDSDQCFEYSDVTNWQYPSGIAVFYGKTYSVQYEGNTIMSLSDVLEQKPFAFEIMAKNIDSYYTAYNPDSYYGNLVMVDNRYFGYVGDADGDCTVSITDATEIQKHLAGLTTLTGARLKAAEIDNQEVSINTATQIQLYLAEITDKL